MNEGNLLHPVACSIAGSDSGGGAGIQADLKTFTALGVWGLTVITAVTAQNPGKVSGVWPMTAEAVRTQAEAVIDEYDVKCFKTGMLAEKSIVRSVSEILPGDAKLVIDPVMISTSGVRLLKDDATEELINTLLPKSLLVTPNLHEAAYLSGMESVSSDEEILLAGQEILDLGADAVLIKGGHGSGMESTDTLIKGSGIKKFTAKRHPAEVHGTGCCLAAAIASYIAKGMNIEKACGEAKKFVERSIMFSFHGKSSISSANPSYECIKYNNKY